jgi:hypothetical protein
LPTKTIFNSHYQKDVKDDKDVEIKEHFIDRDVRSEGSSSVHPRRVKFVDKANRIGNPFDLKSLRFESVSFHHHPIKYARSNSVAGVWSVFAIERVLFKTEFRTRLQYRGLGYLCSVLDETHVEIWKSARMK